METIIFRKNKMFYIDKTKLSKEALKDDVINALYAAIYVEFSGANQKEEYKNLTSLDRLKKLNEFAHNWLNERGLK